MPVDTSIYSRLQTETPDILGSMQKGASLKQMAMQNERLAGQMEREDQDHQATEKLRKASQFGEALESIAGLPEPERAQAWTPLRNQLVQQGIVGEQDAPEHYDPSVYGAYMRRWRESAQGIKNQLTKSEIAKNMRDASHKGWSDPIERWEYQQRRRKEMEQEDKKRELQSYTNVGGWKLAEGATPTSDDAKKFKAGASSARALLENLNEYQNLLDKKGGELAGKNAQRLESLRRDIQLAAKNEDLYGLGVLTGPDLTLLDEIVGDAPTGMSSLNPYAGYRANNKAQQFRDMINTRMNAKAKTYGFEPLDEWNRVALRKKKEVEKDGGLPGTNSFADQKRKNTLEMTEEELLKELED
jgi:hypothetical protein